MTDVLPSTKPEKNKVVIAHRGASAYLPEHTLAAKAMAHAMGADFLEQDIVLSQDHIPLVLHDIYLDTVTDVHDRFPGRARSDGRYYAFDFSAVEIKQLRVQERVDLTTQRPVYPQRFPSGKSVFRVPTLAEEIELIQGLNRSTGQEAGLYPEIKSPSWHRRQGADISRIVLDCLSQYGYQTAEDPIYVQCFDADETRRLRVELKTRLKLVQLIGENGWHEAPTDFTYLRTPAGIAHVASYAEGVGLWLAHVMTGVDQHGKPMLTPLVETAHAHQLAVHAYTLRADDLPSYATNFNQFMDYLVNHAEIDGVFTDFPDLAVSYLQRADQRLSRIK